MARALLFEGFVVLNCDVLFHPQLLDDLLTARHDDALLLAYRRPDDPPFGDEEMKVKVRGGRVVDMSKAMDPADADGENVGMLRFDAERRAGCSSRSSRRIVAAGGLRDWAPRAFAAFAARAAAATRSARAAIPWTEIDFPEDYERAVRDILPQIEARCRRPRTSACRGCARWPAREAGKRCTNASISLRERPFALSPDPDYLYPSRVHREALSYLRYGIEGQAGFVVITGEIGSGKTTLLQTLLRGLDRETTVARLVNTMLEPSELLESILIDFGLEPEPRQAGHAAAARRVPGRAARRRAAGAARRSTRRRT